MGLGRKLRSGAQRPLSEFADLYDAYVGDVYGFLGYRLERRDQVEDLTQQTFEKALRAWDRFDPRRGSPKSWLLSIARNVLIDEHRRIRNSVEIQTPIDVLESKGGASVAPAELSQSAPDLAEALTRLTDREREVIALRFGADLSARDISEFLGLSVSNVHQISSRALRKLRAALK